MHAPFPSRRMAGGRRGPYSMERKAAPARAEAISPARAFLTASASRIAGPVADGDACARHACGEYRVATGAARACYCN